MGDKFDDDLEVIINSGARRVRPREKVAPERARGAAEAVRERDEISAKKVPVREKQISVRDILTDLHDLALSSDDDDDAVVGNGPRARDREAVKAGAAVRKKKAAGAKVQPKVQPKVQDKVQPAELKSLESLEYAEEDPLFSQLTRKQKELYVRLQSEFGIRCTTVQEVLDKAREHGVEQAKKKKKKPKTASKTASDGESSDSARKTPESGRGPQTGEKSAALLVNNREYYVEHTRRECTVKEVCSLPLADRKIATVAMKASPMLKKLMDFVIVQSDFFSTPKSKSVKLFKRTVCQVAASSSYQLCGEKTAVGDALSDAGSPESKLLATFGPDVIDQKTGFVNMDLLTLFGNILIWYSTCKAQNRPQFLHGVGLSTDSVRDAFASGAHLWDDSSYKTVPDERWDALEKLRRNYRYEEDQFYLVLRLANML